MNQLMKDKIEIHSVIDLITNSSTEIFVHSESSIEPVKELLNEFLKLIGNNKTCDDVFEITLECSNVEELVEYYLDYVENDVLNSLGSSKEEIVESIKQIFIDVKLNGASEPEWFKDCDINYNVQTKLVVKSKESEYDKLLELLKTFLYSPNYYEHSSE